YGKILEQVTDYFLSQDAVSSLLTINGFATSGQGQNMGLAFISLKEWNKRAGKENTVQAVVSRAARTFAGIKDGLVFVFNIPAITELGTATGFDFQLIDQGNLGHRKLTEARNQLLGMAAQRPDVLVGVRPNGLEDTPQFKLSIDMEKAQALGLTISDINTTLSSALGGSYVN
ncbi:Cation/multidrug efflux pump, partial [Candidatus Regiella insecticola 5.15]